MPTHDIIDNRSEKLVDHIKRPQRIALRHGRKFVETNTRLTPASWS